MDLDAMQKAFNKRIKIKTKKTMPPIYLEPRSMTGNSTYTKGIHGMCQKRPKAGKMIGGSYGK